MFDASAPARAIGLRPPDRLGVIAPLDLDEVDPVASIGLEPPRPATSSARGSPLTGVQHRSYRHSRRFAGWRDPDSNRGHHDFQSCALPTELSRQRARRLASAPWSRSARSTPAI